MRPGRITSILALIALLAPLTGSAAAGVCHLDNPDSAQHTPAEHSPGAHDDDSRDGDCRYAPLGSGCGATFSMPAAALSANVQASDAGPRILPVVVRPHELRSIAIFHPPRG